VNVRWLPFVIPGSMSRNGEESDEQTHAYRNKMYAEEADPVRGAASLPRQGDGNLCFESGGFNYRGGCDGGSYVGGRR
jgi:hypothetical protein